MKKSITLNNKLINITRVNDRHLNEESCPNLMHLTHEYDQLFEAAISTDSQYFRSCLFGPIQDELYQHEYFGQQSIAKDFPAIFRAALLIDRRSETQTHYLELSPFLM